MRCGGGGRWRRNKSASYAVQLSMGIRPMNEYIRDIDRTVLAHRLGLPSDHAAVAVVLGSRPGFQEFGDNLRTLIRSLGKPAEAVEPVRRLCMNALLHAHRLWNDEFSRVFGENIDPPASELERAWSSVAARVCAMSDTDLALVFDRLRCPNCGLSRALDTVCAPAREP